MTTDAATTATRRPAATAAAADATAPIRFPNFSPRDGLRPMQYKIAAVASAVLAVLAALACSTAAAPDECVAAAENAGAPDTVVRQLENPGDLNAAERIILNRTLQRLGVDDVCSAAAQLPEQDSESASESAADDSGRRISDAGTPRVEASPVSQEADTETCLHAALSRGVNDSLVEEIRRTDSADLTDRQRIRWGRTLSENGIKSQCPGFWSEPVNNSNADKRNTRYFAECLSDLEANLESRRDNGDWYSVAYYQDYLQLLARSYSNLDAADRVILRSFLSEQGGSSGGSSGDCAVGYPQLYSGRWIPADADR